MQSDVQTGERIKAWLNEDAAWEQRYAQYAGERQRIEVAAGLTEADRASQLDRLRGRYFPVAAESMRAHARDSVYRASTSR